MLTPDCTFQGRDVTDDIVTIDDVAFRGWVLRLLEALNTGQAIWPIVAVAATVPVQIYEGDR